MKTKPDHSMLMAYLYGELGPAEREQVEAYLASHAEVREELQQLQGVRQALGQVLDKEVIAPSFIFPEEDTHHRSLWTSSFMKVSLGIAAGLALLMVTFTLVGTRVTWSGGELVIRMGTAEEKPTPTAPAITALEVQQMINQSVQQNNQVWKTNLDESRAELNRSVKSALAMNSSKMNELMQVASTASEAQVRQFAANLQDRNLQVVKDYMTLSSSEQKNYIENLLVDFSKYLQEQRNQDLQMFQTRMTNIEKNTGQFQQETEQILASIISSANPKTKLNSY